MKKPVLLIGGGGHCTSVIDVIEAHGQFQIVGIVDKKEFVGSKLLGYDFIGEDADLPKLIDKYKNVVITTGMIKNSDLRIKLFNLSEQIGAYFPVIVSPMAHVSDHAKIGKGTVVMHQAVINAGSKIGTNCIINTKALIEHDCTIGNQCHISTAAVVNGDCSIGDNVMVGSNSVILQNKKIASNSIIGAGAVVVKNIVQPSVLAGNPAKPI